MRACALMVGRRASRPQPVLGRPDACALSDTPRPHASFPGGGRRRRDGEGGRAGRPSWRPRMAQARPAGAPQGAGPRRPRAHPGVGMGGVGGAVATGRLSRQLALDRIPGKQARIARPSVLRAGRAVIVDIGAHGFSVLELGDGDHAAYREEKSRCSQGTEELPAAARGALRLAPEADLLARPGSGAALRRCPVILKTGRTTSRTRARTGPVSWPACSTPSATTCRCCSARPGADAATVVLAGGVGRSPRPRAVRAAAGGRGMTLAEEDGDDALFLDALGCAVLAARGSARFRRRTSSVAPLACPVELRPSLSEALNRVRRLLPRPPPAVSPPAIPGPPRNRHRLDRLEAVALHAPSRRRSGRATRGPPETVAAAGARAPRRRRAGRSRHRGRRRHRRRPRDRRVAPRDLLRRRARARPERDRRPRRGARACDPRVDTIFEIGGQDAKYIRLAAGRVVDAAMNEACSAGTGSFIEEQGLRRSGTWTSRRSRGWRRRRLRRWASTAPCSWPRSSTRRRRPA